jgi:hypothetical protein
MACRPHPRRVFMPGECNIVVLLARLSHALDKACSTENISCGFSYCPGSRRVHVTALETGTKTGTKSVQTGRKKLVSAQNISLDSSTHA